MTLSLLKENDSIPGLEHAYKMQAAFTQGPNSDVFKQSYGYNDADLPVEPLLQPSCDQHFEMDNNDIIPKTIVMTPVPDWVCDQDQARAWRAGIGS